MTRSRAPAICSTCSSDSSSGVSASCALLDTSARPDTAEQTRRRGALLALSRRGRFNGVTPRLLPQLIHPDRLDEAELTATVMGMAERIGRDAFVRQQTAIMGRPDSRPALGRISCPTLVVCGRRRTRSGA